MLSYTHLCQIAEAVLIRLTHQDEQRHWRNGGGNSFVPAIEGERVERVAGRMLDDADLWLAVKVEHQVVSFGICTVQQDGCGQLLAELDLWQESQLAFDIGGEHPHSREASLGLVAVMAALSRLASSVLQELEGLDAAPEQTPAVQVTIEALEFSGRAYQALKEADIATIGELLALGVPGFRERFSDDFVRADIIRTLATAGYAFEAELMPENILH